MTTAWFAFQFLVEALIRMGSHRGLLARPAPNAEHHPALTKQIQNADPTPAAH
jgi:hypothetical protein